MAESGALNGVDVALWLALIYLAPRLLAWGRKR